MTTLSFLRFVNKYWQFLVIVGMGLYIVYLGNKPVDGIGNNDDRIDSILRIMKTQEKTGTFTQNQPQPIIITMPQPGQTNPGLSGDLLKKFEELESNQAKTQAYIEAISRKVYNNNYSDSIVDITVKDVVEGGKLTNQKVDWKVKPQEIKYYENIYQLKPQFTITGGLQFATGIDSLGFSREQLYPYVGYKGRNGWGVRAGINILNTKEWMFAVEKDLLRKYKKVEEKKQF